MARDGSVGIPCGPFPILAPPGSDYHVAYERARALLCQVLPDPDRRYFERTNQIRIRAASGKTYDIAPWQTQILDARSRLIGRACLQLTVPAPSYDRMLAEYLLLRNDEARYWRIANITRFSLLEEYRSRKCAIWLGMILGGIVIGFIQWWGMH